MSALGNGAMSMMSYRASVTRPAAVVNGRRGNPVTVHTDVPCTSLMPVSSEVAVRMPDKVPSELLQAFVPGSYEIQEGDWLVHEDGTHLVRGSDLWKTRNSRLRLLILDSDKVSHV